MADAKKAVKNAEEKKWKIRDAEGKVFGPATLESLKAWARDGRLAEGQELSCDDETWLPVDSMPELEMDWVTELAPGKFFGPVNRDAMKEFIRNGDVSADMPQFVRMKSVDETPEALRAENAELKAQIEALRKDFGVRTAKLEADLAVAQTERRMAVGELSSRDLEFEAERQAFAAERSRMEAEKLALAAEKTKLNAEIAKASKRAEVLSAQVADAEARSKSRESDIARIAELEKLAENAKKEIKELKAALEDQAADARRKLKDADIGFAKEREEFQGRLRDVKALTDKIAALQNREESVRRVIMQAMSIIGKAGVEIEEADAVLVDDPAGSGER